MTGQGRHTAGSGPAAAASARAMTAPTSRPAAIEIRNAGKAVLWINEDLDELMLCCDRIGVLYGGQLAGEAEKKDFDKYRIGEMMTGGGYKP